MWNNFCILNWHISQAGTKQYLNAVFRECGLRLRIDCLRFRFKLWKLLSIISRCLDPGQRNVPTKPWWLSWIFLHHLYHHRIKLMHGIKTIHHSNLRIYRDFKEPLDFVIRKCWFSKKNWIQRQREPRIAHGREKCDLDRHYLLSSQLSSRVLSYTMMTEEW